MFQVENLFFREIQTLCLDLVDKKLDEKNKTQLNIKVMKKEAIEFKNSYQKIDDSKILE